MVNTNSKDYNETIDETREQIQKELFEDEKILFCIKVFDDKKIVQPVIDQPSHNTNPLKKLGHKIQFSVTNEHGTNINNVSSTRKQSAQPGSTGNSMANLFQQKEATKRIRFICLTIKKHKHRLHKIKQTIQGASFQISKTWNLDELKSIENIDLKQFILYLNKQYIFQTEEPKEKIEFIYVLLKICSKNLKKQPKLINVSEAGLQDELKTYQNRERFAAEQEDEEAEAVNNARRGLSPLEEAFLKVQYEQEELNVFDVLMGFDWKVGNDASALELRLLNELTALEAANIHAIIQADEQSEFVVSEIDNALAEIEKVEDWLNLYSVELKNMGKDIGNIESQNKGLQVQTQNQKALQAELQRLMVSLSFSEEMVYTLDNEDLNDFDGIKRLETACSGLQEALQRKVDDSLKSLNAVSERMAVLGQFVTSFSNRLFQHLKAKIQKESDKLFTAESLKNQKFANLNLPVYENMEDELLPYRNLVGWIKEMDPRRHTELQIFYVQSLNKVFKKDIKDYYDVIRANPYIRSNDELDYLFQQYSKTLFFTNNSLSPGATGFKPVSMASMLGHRKAHSADSRAPPGSMADELKRKLRFNDSTSQFAEATGDEKIPPDEALKKFLSQLTVNMLRIQNFIVDFFHLSGCKPPNTKISLIMADLTKPRDLPKDLRATKKLEELLSTFSDGLNVDILQWMESAVKVDLSFILGLLVVLEVERKNAVVSKIPFLSLFYDNIHEKMIAAMDKFIDEQVKAIEDTKVNIKGKIRVVSFVKVFPVFVRRMEAFIRPYSDVVELEARKYMNSVYDRITKLMFNVLQKIAVEAENAVEDKEQMNGQILSLENMHHLFSELRGQKVSFLEAQVKYAKNEYDANLNAYIRTVVRKPLGKLLDFFEGVEDLLKTKSPEEVSFHFSYNKAALKNVIAAYPGKDIKKAIEALKKKVEKHFSEEEGLLQVVWHGVQEEFIRLHRHFEALISKCYPETDAKLGFTVEDLCIYFSDLAKMK